MVGDWNREKGRDNEKESENRPLGFRFWVTVVKTLIRDLDPGQDIASETVTNDLRSL